MFNEEMIKYMTDLFNNPLYKKGFYDFFLMQQREGIEAAQKFWRANADKNNLLPGVAETYEKMVDFYIILGFVPKTKYDEVLNENTKLKKENKFLKDTIGELQLTLFNEGGEKIQQVWDSIIDKQLEVNKEIGKSYFELFRKMKSSGV